MDTELRVGCSSMKRAFLMDTEVRVGCLSMKWAFLMDAEVRIRCLSMKRAFLMDTELRVGCSASPDLAPVLAGAAVDDARIGFFDVTFDSFCTINAPAPKFSA